MPTTSDKPQTLAERILALNYPFKLTDSNVLAIWNTALSKAAAIADAVPPAEQAGDVGRAVRVKQLVWSGNPRWPSTSWASGYQINEQDADAWLMTAPNGDSVMAETIELAQAAAQADYTARITAALEPDPTPALGWKAMQTAAKASILAHSETARRRMRAAHDRGDAEGYDNWSAIVSHLDIALDAILALPGPTDAQVLAEAVKLPEVQELVLGAQWARNRLDIIADESWLGDGRDLKRSIIGIFADFDAALAALTAWRDAQ